MDLFYLWCCVKREHINENRDDMINYLKSNNIMEDITGNLNEYLNKNIFHPMNIKDYSFQYSPSSEIL